MIKNFSFKFICEAILKYCLSSVFVIATISLSFATEYYCDPETGSMSNNGTKDTPWGSLEDVFKAGKTFSEGDIIYLLSGFHGEITISQKNTGHVTIKAAADSKPTLNNIAIRDASYWTLSGLTISPEFAPRFDKVTLVKIFSGSNIIVENCDMFSVDDISSWDKDDWIENACYAVVIEDDNNILRNNVIRNIKFGVVLEGAANKNTIENNMIANFSADGMRILGDYNTVLNNTIQDNYNVDSNHDDGMQSYSRGAGKGTVYGVIFSGNTIIQTTDPNRPYQGSLQGIGNFDGMFEDWVIENNVVYCDVYHGIALYGAINCKVNNNTVLDSKAGSPVPWIKITAHKFGMSSTGNTMINNLSSDIANDANIGRVENNIVISPSDYESYFVDYKNFNFNLRSGCPAISAGTESGAPEVDIKGNSRPIGDGIDVGAYEYSDAVIEVTGVSISEDALELEAGQSFILKARPIPADATNAKVKWSSDDPSIASVDENGTVTGYGEGTTNINATTIEGNFEASCSVSVENNGSEINLSLNKPVEASVESQSANPAVNLTNGNASDDSRWSAETFPQWAVIDLGNVFNITRTELYTYQGRDYQYTIETSTDGESFTEIVDRSDNNESAKVLVDNMSGSARFVKIIVTGSQTYDGTWMSLNELMVFGYFSDEAIPVTGISLSETSLSLEAGESHNLIEMFSPDNASNRGVIWTSANESIATVDAKGLITAISKGETTISVKSNEGGFSASCTVIVTKSDIVSGNLALNKPVTVSHEWGTSYGEKLVDGLVDDGNKWVGEGLPQTAVIDLGQTFSLSEIRLYAYENRAYQYTIDISNDGELFSTLVDRSGNEDDSQPITNAVNGTARYVKLTVSGGYGYTGVYASINELEVYGTSELSGNNDVAVSGVAISPSSLSLIKGNSSSLVGTIFPETAGNKSVTWSTSDPFIATVNDNGLVTAISAGEAVISVMTDDGGFTDECSVVVKEENITTSISNATNGDEFSNGLIIFPNPLIGEMLTIRLDKTGISKNCSLRIFNSVGKIVYSSNKIVFDNCTHQASVSLIRHLPKGLYIANLSDGHVILNTIIIAK